MKKILLKFALALAFIGAIIISSCEKKPVIPPCERDNVGTVTVVNRTGYSIWVDVTWGNIVENYEKLLNNNGSYKYSEIPAGSIEIWAKISSWEYDVEYLNACENMTYTWTLAKSGDVKSAELMLEISDGDGNILYNGSPSGGDKQKQ